MTRHEAIELAQKRYGKVTKERVKWSFSFMHRLFHFPTRKKAIQERTTLVAIEAYCFYAHEVPPNRYYWFLCARTGNVHEKLGYLLGLRQEDHNYDLDFFTKVFLPDLKKESKNEN